MGAAAKGLADGQEEHGGKEQPQMPGQAECQEAGYIGGKREHHGLAFTAYIGDSARGNLEQIDRRFAEGDKQAN